MNTFWGCTTEQLDELAREIGEKAERLVNLIELIRRSAEAAAWTGPDAEAFRQRSTAVAGDGMDLVGVLRGYGEQLDEEAQEQEICSQAKGGTAAGGDPSERVRGELPEEWKNLPRISGPLPDDGFPAWWPRAEDGKALNPVEPGPSRPLSPEMKKWIEDHGPDEETWEKLRPTIGQPISGDRPWDRPAEPGAGGTFDIDPATLARAEGLRTAALEGVPYAEPIQTGMQLHEAQGDLYDEARETMEDHGLGRFTPLVSLAETPHTLNDVVLGEKSVLGRTAENLDRTVANYMTIGEEVSTAVGEGDLAGAAGAMERGMFRQADITADIVTTNAFPAAAETTADLLGTGADMADMVDPGAGSGLRDAEQFVDGMGEDYQDLHDRVTDGERYYDMRREYVPMPWDQRV